MIEMTALNVVIYFPKVNTSMVMLDSWHLENKENLSPLSSHVFMVFLAGRLGKFIRLIIGAAGAGLGNHSACFGSESVFCMVSTE